MSALNKQLESQRDEAMRLLDKAQSALDVTLDALVTISSWGLPYEHEARTALRRVSEILKEVEKTKMKGKT